MRWVSRILLTLVAIALIAYILLKYSSLHVSTSVVGLPSAGELPVACAWREGGQRKDGDEDLEQLCRQGANGNCQWGSFPLCSIAQKSPSPSPDLPPIADVFATGSPCADLRPSIGESMRTRLTPTLHFVLDLNQPNEGKEIGGEYKSWFPESRGFSTHQYTCVFHDGQSTPVSRSQNHDRALWPESGRCSEAARYRSVVLICEIPLHIARETLLQSQKASKTTKSGDELDSDMEKNLAKIFQVTLARSVDDGKTVKHKPMSFGCPLYKPNKALKGVPKPLPNIEVNAMQKKTVQQETSVGICTMVNSECGLQEWLEYNKFIGVKNAYIYDNTRSRDESDLIASAVHSWNAKNGRKRFTRIVRWHSPPRDQWWISQTHAMNSCLRRFSAFHQWIIVMDPDERLVPLSLPAEPQQTDSLVAYAINRVLPAADTEPRSSLIVMNWDMRNSENGDKKVCGTAEKLLIEYGDMQCKGGPTEDRMKSIMSTDWKVNQIVDQGHCTAIGQAPTVLDVQSEIRMNHYFSHTQSSCKDWEKADQRLLTSREKMFTYIRERLKDVEQRKSDKL